MGLGSGMNNFVKGIDMVAHNMNPGEISGVAKALHSNQAVNKIVSSSAFQSVVGGADRAAQFLGGAGKYGSISERLASSDYGARDFVRMGLGTYAVGSTAGRIASGGGLYKDSQGNFDVVGIPIL